MTSRFTTRTIVALTCAGCAVLGGRALAQEDALLPAVDLTEQEPTTIAVAGEIIVKPRPGTRGALGLSASDAREAGLRATPRVTSGGELVYELNFDTLIELRSRDEMESRMASIVETLNARSDVLYAQLNWILTPHAEPDDTHYDKQWHYWTNGTGAGESRGGISLPDIWDQTMGDHAVTVAVLDTGILPDHPDISGSGNVVPGYDMITDTGIANDGDGRDADPTDPGDAVTANECFPGSRQRDSSWHGTHVAGTIGAVATDNATGVAGSNWTVSIQPVRVLGKCGGTTLDINDAMRWAAGLPVPGVPANPTPARVLNLSLGGEVPCSSSPATQQAIDDVVAAGATVVVSAGNSARDAAGFTPASCDGVVTVAASEARGHLASRYSNFGATVEIMAPGGDVQRDDNGDSRPDGVLSTVQGGYAFYNGTSMAAPHVSGVAALLLANDDTLTPAEILQAMQDSALTRTTAECPQPCGAGLLQAVLPEGGSEPPVETTEGGYEYAAKLLCGTREDFRETGTARVDTIVNIRNPGDAETRLRKWVELGIPPGGQEPGSTARLGEHGLTARTAIATDCADVARRAFGGTLPAAFVDGFLVIRSDDSLDVTAVYRSDLVGEEKVLQSDLEVEPVRERRIEAGE